MTTVWNMRHPNVPSDAVYVGRGTPWGNPFVMSAEWQRNDVCDKFEAITLPTLDVSPPPQPLHTARGEHND